MTRISLFRSACLLIMSWRVLELSQEVPAPMVKERYLKFFYFYSFFFCFIILFLFLWLCLAKISIFTLVNCNGVLLNLFPYYVEWCLLKILHSWDSTSWYFTTPKEVSWRAYQENCNLLRTESHVFEIASYVYIS